MAAASTLAHQGACWLFTGVSEDLAFSPCFKITREVPKYPSKEPKHALHAVSSHEDSPAYVSEQPGSLSPGEVQFDTGGNMKCLGSPHALTHVAHRSSQHGDCSALGRALINETSLPIANDLKFEALIQKNKSNI